MTIQLQDIQQAAALLREHVIETPCIHSRVLSELTGAGVWIKFENLQFTGSFKERGALVKLLSLNEAQRQAGVIAMSAGNHAQAVAYHAQRLGIPAVIVMPETTPNVKVEHTRAFGAEVILHGETLSEAAEMAHKIAAERGLCLVHPYDDELIMAGQGTIALEMLEQCPAIDTLVIPIGGGGLIAGNAVAARTVRPGLLVYGVETERFPSMRQALAGEPIECGTATIAEGIAVKQPGKLTQPVIREQVEDILLVSESSLERAVLLLLEVEKSVAEGAGAAGLAAMLQHPDRFRGRRVGLVLSGGNIDLTVLSSIIQRGLAHSGRLARLRIDVRDRSEALAELTAIIARSGANIASIHHHRTFTDLPLQLVELEFVVQTRGQAHVDELRAALQAAGYTAKLGTALHG